MKKNEQKQKRKRMNSQSAPQKLPPLNKKQISNDKPCLNQITHQDQGIVGLLYEYFLKNNFLDTLDSFQKDCRQKGFKPNNRFIESFKQEIIQAFQHGNREVFMARFGQYVPISMRNKDIQTMKFQFYIQVYFFVYSIHPQLGKKRTIDTTSKQAFIHYLEGRGATLAKSPQLLQYYALAYLDKPQEYQNFKTIFTKQWINQLKKQLVFFIQKLYPSNKTPAIISIYDKFVDKNMEKNSQQSLTQPDQQPQIEQQIQPQQSQVIQPNNNPLANQLSSRVQQSGPKYQSLKSPNAFEIASDRQKESLNLKIAQLQEQKKSLMGILQNVKKRYQSLQINYKEFTDGAQNTLMQSQTKWFKITQQFYNIASNLREACSKLQNNQPLDDPTVVDKLGKKLSKYEAFVKMNIEDLISENVDFSLFERPQNDLSVDMVRRNNDSKNTFLIPLDFDKVKEKLTALGQNLDIEKCYLLEALKWRLTKTRGALYKRQIVLSYVLNDILNLKQGEEMVKRFMNSPNPTVLLKFMQFLNAFTKDYYGRKYLCHEAAVKNAMALLKKENLHENIVVIIVSFLQQLSVRKAAQQLMIEGDMIKWFVTKLKKQRQTMSEQLMQYSLATIINLLLKKQGLKKSQEIKQQILTTLIDLMEIELIQIREYVHGAIYPLFYKKVFRDKAKQYGLQENIKYLREHTDSQYIINQLNYLEAQLAREDEQKEEENEDQEDADEIFDEEFGQDFDFQTEIDDGQGLSGEQLLIQKYSLTGPDAVKQLSMIRQQAENTLKNKSVYVASNLSERPGTSNKLPMRKNVSNNNSVYSNKSSSRVLKSELMNRSQLNKNQAKQKLDTVQPDNSEKEMSMRDFIEDHHDDLVRNEFSSQKQMKKKQPIFISDSKVQNQYDNRVIVGQNIMQNDSFNTQQKKAQRPLKPYENNTEYKEAFIARSSLVRTPPQR